MGDEKSIDSTKRIVLVAKLDPMLTTSPAHKMDSFIENSYPWIPQSDIVVCAEGEHARLHIPVRGGGVPVAANTNVIGRNGHHGVRFEALLGYV